MDISIPGLLAAIDKTKRNASMSLGLIGDELAAGTNGISSVGGVTDVINRGVLAPLLGAGGDIAEGVDWLQKKVPALRKSASVMEGVPTSTPKTSFGYEPAVRFKSESLPSTADWQRAMADAGITSRAERPLVEFGAGLAAPFAPAMLGKILALKAEKAVSPVIYSSKKATIYDPKPQPERLFNDDYPEGVAGQGGSPLAFDIEGRPLIAKYVSGRRVVGGMDEGLRGVSPDGITGESGLRFGVKAVPRSGGILDGDVGKYKKEIEGGDLVRNIYIDKTLPPDKFPRVLAHEIAHGIDDLAFTIPQDGIKKELRTIYEQLNTDGWFKPGRGATPEGQGYKGNDIQAELMAEAIRAYMIDPNYIKSVAPKTAARIRAYVNDNHRLNKTIQFNGAAPLATGGLLTTQAQEEYK